MSRLTLKPDLATLPSMVTSSCFVDGKPQAALALNDRGLNYGHGVFETMRLCAAQLPLWHYHRERLSQGAARLGIALDLPRLQVYLQQALEAFPADGMVKLLLTAGLGPRGYRQQGQAASYVLQYFPLPSPPLEPAALCLQLCQYALPHNARLAGIKHLNRLDQVLAAAELDEGVDGLLLDVEGHVVEALSSNIFLFDGHNWLTPELTLCGVAGVMRRLLCEEIIPALGQRVLVEPIALSELINAQEVFVCNSVRGIQPVSELVGRGDWSAASSRLPESQTQEVMTHLARVYPCFAA